MHVVVNVVDLIWLIMAAVVLFGMTALLIAVKISDWCEERRADRELGRVEDDSEKDERAVGRTEADVSPRGQGQGR